MLIVVCFQIGNLSFYTTEEQIYELFSKCASPEDGGGIKRIIMGLDRNNRCASRPPLRITYSHLVGHHVGFVSLSIIHTQRLWRV